MRLVQLKHLMTLNTYKNEAKKLDLNVVANEFDSGDEHRMRLFGNFTQAHAIINTLFCFVIFKLY